MESSIGLDLYNKTVEIIGPVPASAEFIYCIGAILLFGAIIIILLSPLLLIKAVAKR